MIADAARQVRRLFCCAAPRWGLTMAGLAAATVALAAYPLGLDNNPAMGPRRALLLLAGLAILLAVHYGRVSALIRARGPGMDSRPAPEPGPQNEALSEGRRNQVPHPPRSMWPALSLVLAAILFLYLWLVTAGQWTKPLPQTTFFYDMLADAFVSGQTFLKQAPDPRLAELANPYDPAARAGIPRCSQGMTSGCFLLDATYFGGKYYLYWGPAPAAILALLKLNGLGRLGDATIALIAVSAHFTLLTLCLTQLWFRYFPELPRWLLAPTFILAGLAYPLPWALDAPHIYEAAILLGDVFLVAGLALAIPVLTSHDRFPGRLALIGTLWSLSFGSRMVLALPITVLTGAIVWRLAGEGSIDSPPRATWKALAALALPLVVSATAIGLYNFARFSNPLESGWRFALAGDDQSAGLQGVFEWANIPTNAYNYLFAPASVSGQFPFLEPRLATRTLGPIPIPHSGLFHSEYVTGLIVTTPFLLFAAYLSWWWACIKIDCPKAPRRAAFPASDLSGLRGLIFVLFSASIAGFLPILAVYAVTARYLLDVLPFLTILSALGAWAAYASHTQTRAKRLVIGSAILATAGASTIISVLLALNNLSR